MHLDIYHVQMHRKIDVCREAKTTNNLGLREYPVTVQRIKRLKSYSATKQL